ncbi:Sulfite efflux pump SSU1 [Trichophyton rubrum] [Rhizoctonia solani]|uniref:Sulfite efflux pump SSU1 [Trichophyton rubrum] n=1 Tax=Rhizoctonia solani TaxID=456999 RepID=A0A0K6GF97_9AGAM|nr:Sulfite efflux pump SSU1 [Trichophyton rubrum] [Rhizoctonia solani]
MIKGGAQPSLAKKFVSDRIKDFTPAWFAVVMGTGAVSGLLHSFPYGHKPVLHAFGAGMLLFNVILLFVFLGFAITRYVRHPEVFKAMLLHPLQCLYVGCLPMGFATIINALLNLRDDYFPESRTFVYVLWGLWWFDIAVGIPAYFLMLYTMISRHEHSIETLNPVWILPTITLIVPSTTGALLAEALIPYSTTHTIIGVFVSAGTLALGLGLAVMLMVLYLLRLITHGVAKNLIAAKFIPVGPCGQAGSAFIVLGQVTAKLAENKARQSVLLDAAQPLALLGFAAAYFLWTFGIWWVVLSAVSVYETFRDNRPKFAAGFWGMVFPMGVYSMLTINLAETLDSGFFRVVASVLCLYMFTLWTTLTLLTIRSLIQDREALLNSTIPFIAPQPERTQNGVGLGDRTSSADTVFEQ